VSARAVSLSHVGRAGGEGWCVFTRGATRGECILTPAGSLGMAGVQFADMNSGTIVEADGAAPALRMFVERLRARGLPGILAVLSTAADEVAPVAAELDLAAGPVVPLMCVRAADARRVEHDYSVWRVDDQAGVDDAAAVLADAFDISEEWVRGMYGPDFAHLPGADVFAAGRHGQAAAVVGTARLGTTVGVYAVGTRQAHRRRGAASAAMSAAVDHHVSSGAHLFVLLSAPEAEPLYKSLGFAPVDHPSLWVVPGP
jgi:GNAT superfamily N-acetyltransferase